MSVISDRFQQHQQNWATGPASALSPPLIRRLADPDDQLADLLLDQLGGAALAIDRTGAVVRSSARLRQMVGRDANVDSGASALCLFAADQRDMVAGVLQTALLGASPPATLMTRLDQGGGADLAVQLTAHPLLEADGQASGLILSLSDMSTQLRLEADLAQSQKLQAVGTHAAGILHDFNNLLTAVLGGADLIAARRNVDVETLEDAAQIRDSAMRGAALVRRLLTFGSQSASQHGAISINRAIDGLSGLLARLLGDRIQLIIDVEAHQCMARIDPTQLDQVLINFAVNARDAMPDGGTLALRAGSIMLHHPLLAGKETIPCGRYVLIEVQDSGSGIAPELLPHIFDAFLTTKGDHGGTGLGLSVVLDIIHQSDGFLAVESRPGEGTRMRIYLPQLDDGPVPVLLHDAAPGSQGAFFLELPPNAPRPRPAVLLVEDERIVRRLAERALSEAGWTVLAAESAEAALQMVHGQAAPDLQLLVSDVIMPGIDGLDLADRLRARWPDLPVLLVSGYVDEALRRILHERRIEFLAKPYRLPELTVAARACVSRF